MNRRAPILVTFLLLSAAMASNAPPAKAAVPDFVTFSGRLTDGTGWGMSSEASLTFNLYSTADGAEILWTQTFDPVAVDNGYFSVIFGDGEDPNIPATLNVTEVFAAHDEVWIGVALDGGAELVPRQQIGSVPYAVNARYAENAGPALMDKLKLAIATAACASHGITGGMMGVWPFTQPGDTGDIVCARDAFPGWGQTCTGTVYPGIGTEDYGSLATNGECWAEYPVGFYACCDDP